MAIYVAATDLLPEVNREPVSYTHLLVVLMMGFTAFSQYVIIPAMERDRVAVGGAIDTSDQASPYTADFNKLHNRSEHVELAILLLGLATVVLIAHSESTPI